MPIDLNRKRKTKNPCLVCFMHLERCICSSIPKLSLRTKLSLIIHHRELKRTTNTGRLAIQALTNSQMYIRGLDKQALDLTNILSDSYETYILYPSDDAIDIESLKPNKPVHLIVADGNWRQAGKLHRRHSELSHIKKVKISQANLATIHLRNEHMKEGYSTLEAIALAIGIFEGEKVRDELLNLYQVKLQATLKGRGKLSEHS
jgi:DTW domain-containing protein YfiP